QPGIKIKTSNRFEDYTAITSYRALVGSRVELPCDVTLPSADDSISLILWYKNDRKSAPIYSVDARNTPVERAKHFASENLKNRAKFDLSFRPALLQIDPVKEDDVGIYLCRVDFKWARTINTLSNLSVIIPPRQVLIKDEHQNPLHDIIGPYDEGSNVRLICEAYGGTPSPSLIWLRDGVVIDNSYNLTRINNSNNVKPLDVQIVAFKRALFAGTKADIICQSRGARPPATLTWFLDNEPLTAFARHTKSEADPGSAQKRAIIKFKLEDNELDSDDSDKGSQQIEQEGDEVIIKCDIDANPPVSEIKCNATLVLKVARREHNGNYKCRAVNEQGNGESKETSFSIHYAPICATRENSQSSLASQSSAASSKAKSNLLSSSSSLVYNSVPSEKATVQCKVDANPKDVSFYWTFNGTEISSLISNSETVTSSSSIASSKSAKTANSKHQHIFERQVDNGLESILYFTPSSVSDFGLLACWAKNIVGSQLEPCLFTLLPANPPQSLQSCLITNQTWDSIFVECSYGDESKFDNNKKNSTSSAGSGGASKDGKDTFHRDSSSSSASLISSSRATNYHLEVYNSKRDQLLYNLSNHKSATFLISGLSPNTAYVLVVYSSNSVGTSRPLTLTTETLIMLTRKQGADFFQTDDIIDSRLLLIVLGSSSVFLLMALIILIILKIRKRDEMTHTTRKQRNNSSNNKSRSTDSSCKDDNNEEEKQSERKGTNFQSSNFIEQEFDRDECERNFRQVVATNGRGKSPDVIPTKRDFLANSSNYSSLGNGRFLNHPTISSMPGTIRRNEDRATIKIDTVPHVTVVDTRPQSRSLITPHSNVS
ncbi:nephrin-like protein, partial [Dinothrombium tinctorium]